MRINEVISGPEISTHIQGTTMWIDMFAIPEDLRRRGLGRKLYDQWEKSLPLHIKNIQLVASDSGAGPSDAFWDAMGFDYFHADVEDLNYEDKQHMIKYL